MSEWTNTFKSRKIKTFPKYQNKIRWTNINII